MDPSGDCVMNDASESDSHFLGSCGISDIWGDQQVLPRVGSQYQVNIPPLITESEPLQLIKSSTLSRVMDNITSTFRTRLFIPITWVPKEVDGTKNDSNESLSFKRKRKIKNCARMEPPKLKTLSSEGCIPVPGCSGSSWSDIEKESFLLGLYIFGKNLVKVKNFVESKEMRDILSYYYREFYKSTGYLRWCKCRKIGSRRYIRGQKIFTGWRQQEFLSRLIPRVPEEHKNTLMEVSKSFREGKITLDEYVSTLKANSSLGILIEVFQIGKGNKDLTSIVMENTRINQAIARLDIPVGKAYSTLTSEDISRFLTGDIRLSKSKSNDLFWEAIWPRLLARGWHSEQPKDRTSTSSNHSLVFIVPGIKKFSRKKLVKGDQYYDSVTDVLNKVALDPKLLELDSDPATDGMTQENGWGRKKMKLDEDGDFNHQHHSYLKPQVSMEFTIVDTSLGNGESQYPVRELRRLPIETTNTSPPTSFSSENKEDGFDELVDKPKGDDMMLTGQEGCNSVAVEGTLVHSEFPGSLTSIQKEHTLVDGSDDTNFASGKAIYHNTRKLERNSSKVFKCQFSRRKKFGQSVTKHRSLTACCQAEESCSNGFSMDEPNLHSSLTSPSIVSEVSPFPKSSSKNGQGASSERMLVHDNSTVKSSHEKHQQTDLIDLSLPHVPSDVDTDEPFVADVLKTRSDQNSKEVPLPFSESASEETQPTLVARRHSTRNRPLTQRALEAFAFGFLDNNRKPKNLFQAQGRSTNRGKTGDITVGVVESKLEERVECGNNMEVVSNLMSY